MLNSLDYYKYGAFLSGSLEQQFKMQSHFGIFDSVIGEGQWHDDTELEYLIWMCEFFEILIPVLIIISLWY